MSLILRVGAALISAALISAALISAALTSAALISGTFICNYTKALTGEINPNIIGYIGNLTKS